MAQTIKIKRGNKSQLNNGVLKQGEMGFCLDTKEVYIGDGENNIFVGKVMSGPYLSRPNAQVKGRFFYVTSGENLGYLYIDTGITWNKVNSLALSDLRGSIDNIKDGSTFAKVKKSDITNGQVNKISDGSKTTTASEIRDHINDLSEHRVIEDEKVSNINLWSSQKINAEIYNAIRGLEWQDSVKSKILNCPPNAPVKGERYLIPTSCEGIWGDKENKIAHYNGVAWEYYAPDTGWSLYVDNEKKNYVFNGSTWVRSGEANQNVKAGNGLLGGGRADEITLEIGQGNGIKVTSSAIEARASKGIEIDLTGIKANIDSKSIIFDSSDGDKLTVSEVDGGTF
ncbi:DUF2793 domain-containing protein [Clostridium rectalis]|uniref:DUF2793 domain-containing protein n=1 Tax=Clostridium rectalis TaxID=2040295 RepID=UPI000F642B71|nr:DUF2793 domain-containing protein [Clostridium rectalis]